MRHKIIILLLLLAPLLSACDVILMPDVTSTPISAPTLTPVPTETPIPPTLTPQPTHTPRPKATAQPEASRPDVWLEARDVLIHPDGGIYSGDRVSLQVWVHAGLQDVAGTPVMIELPGGNHSTTATGPVMAGSTNDARFDWMWNTTGFWGAYPVTITLDPSHTLGAADAITTNNSLIVTLTVQPASAKPAAEQGARWATYQTACCRLHYVTGTAAERDLSQIAPIAGRATEYAERQFGERLRGKLDVYLISRVLGHGGFAQEAIAISYLDRNYAGGDLEMVIRHETAHILHRQYAGRFTTFIAEGVAVWATGGHFKPEPLEERAAALVQHGGYIPLRELAGNFYPNQHETGYLEAGGLIEYLVQRNGLDTLKQFLRAAGHEQGDDEAIADKALRQVYGIGLEDMEKEWLGQLGKITPAEAEQQDLDATLAYYDTVRRYQEQWDRSAYYQRLWVPDLRQAVSQNIVADLVRHPRSDENVALETMLLAAHEAMARQDWAAFDEMLAATNHALDNGLASDPIAAQYLAIVRAARAAGWEAQAISLAGGSAQVTAAAMGEPATPLASVAFKRGPSGWQAQ